MSRDRDDFEGIDISGPWGGIRVGTGRFRSEDWDEDAEVRAVRRRVRQRLDFLKNLAFFVLIVGGLALLDGATGGGWWVQWVAIIWGAFLALQFVTTFVAPLLWSSEAEERMVQRELARRRRRAHVRPDGPGDPPVS